MTDPFSTNTMESDTGRQLTVIPAWPPQECAHTCTYVHMYTHEYICMMHVYTTHRKLNLASNWIFLGGGV